MGAAAAQAQTAGGEDLSEARLTTWSALNELTRRIDAALRDQLRREFGWSLARFEVVAALHRAEDGLRMSALAAALVTSNGNVTVLVESLAAEGLAIRVADRDDRRATVVQLTQRGREAYAARAAAHAVWIDAIFAGLGQADLDRLGALAATLREGLAEG